MINKVLLIGRVGKDPEVKQTTGGSVAKFSLATTESYKNKAGEKVENTEWHNIVIFGKLTEIVEKYVKKGDLIYVEGKIIYGSYDDKDGNKRYTTDIKVDVLKMLGSKGETKNPNIGRTTAPDDDTFGKTSDESPF
jgi:single-strand DNA-binding protein